MRRRRIGWHLQLAVAVVIFIALNIFLTSQWIRKPPPTTRRVVPAPTQQQQEGSGTEAPPKEDPGPSQPAPVVTTETLTVAPGVEDDETTASPLEDKYVVDPSGWDYESFESMVEKAVPKKHWGHPSPDELEEALSLKEETGCDILKVPFAPEDDAKCIGFLTNTSNWKRLVPLDQKYDERTIKFRVDFRTNAPFPLESVLKVPQRLFPNEAFSEAASFHADRVLEVNRIPPTGWVCIPSSMIRDAVRAGASKVKTVDEFLEESKVHNFTEWIEIDLFEFAMGEQLLVNEGKADECIRASIQLFMADVHHLLDSRLKIPYIPHNASWMRHFDFTAKNKPDFLEETWAVTMIHLGQLSAFDYVLGNPDRSPNKNNFVVGGCKHYCHEKRIVKIRHPGHPTFIHLDQGMGFYGSPSTNAITKAKRRAVSKHNPKPNTMCLFRAPLLNKLYHLSKTDPASEKGHTIFQERMRKALPPDVLRQVGDRRLSDAGRRIVSLLKVVDECLASDFRRYVIAP